MGQTLLCVAWCRVSDPQGSVASLRARSWCTSGKRQAHRNSTLHGLSASVEA